MQGLYWLGLSLLFMAGIYSVKPLRHYQSSLQDSIYPKIFAYFGPDFHFAAQGGNLVPLWRAMNLLPHYDLVEEEDHLTGSHNGVQLELGEATLSIVTRDSKGNRRTHEVFHGLLLRLEFNKSFHGKTLLLKDGGWLGNSVKGDSHHGLQHVKLEDPEFESLFQVFASDQIESRRLLTPAFMQRLLNLAAISNAKPQACFYGNALYLALASHHDRFAAPNPFLPATFEGEIRDILDEMHQVFRMIDELQLQHSTGI